MCVGSAALAADKAKTGHEQGALSGLVVTPTASNATTRSQVAGLIAPQVPSMLGSCNLAKVLNVCAPLRTAKSLSAAKVAARRLASETRFCGTAFR